MTEDELQKLRIELASKLWLVDVNQTGRRIVEHEGRDRLLHEAFRVADIFIERARQELKQCKPESTHPQQDSEQPVFDEKILQFAGQCGFVLQNGLIRICRRSDGEWFAVYTVPGTCGMKERFIAPDGLMYSQIEPFSGEIRNCWLPSGEEVAGTGRGPMCLFPTAMDACRAAAIFKAGRLPGEH